METESIREIGKSIGAAYAGPKKKLKRVGEIKNRVSKLKELIRDADGPQITGKVKANLHNSKTDLRNDVKELVKRLENTRKFKRIKCETPWGMI